MDLVPLVMIYLITCILKKVLHTGEEGGLTTCEVNHLDFKLQGVDEDRHRGFTKAAGGRDTQLYQRGVEIKNHRPWSAVSIEEMSQVAQKMGVTELKPEWIGANLLFEGIESFSQIPPLSRLVFENDGPVLVVYEENTPCKYPQPHIEKHIGTTLKKFAYAAKKKRGLVGWVEKAGIAKANQQIELWVPKFYFDLDIDIWKR